MATSSEKAKSGPFQRGRIGGYLIGWGIVASLVEIVATKMSEGRLPWTGWVADTSMGGKPTALLLFLLRMAFETLMGGLLDVALCLAVFHGCVRLGAARWAGFAVIAGTLLVSGYLLWVFIETWNDHGYVQTVEQRVAEASPLIAAMLVTAFTVAVRERSRET